MRTAGLLCGPPLALLVYVVNPGGHAPEARKLLAVLAVAVVFWMTEAIPLAATALLASALCVATGVAPIRSVLAPYADPVIFLFTGTFLMSEAFQKYGLDRRIAGSMLRSKRFGRTPGGLMAGFGLSSAAISTCLSNTATAALMTPIASGAVRSAAASHAADDARAPSVPPWASGVLLMVAYGASIGGMATLIGTPPNLLVAGFVERLAGVKVGFVPWLVFGLPIATTLFVLSVFLTRWTLGVGRRGDRDEAAADAGGRPPEAPGGTPTSRAGARWTVAAFALAGLLWTLPSLASLVLGGSSAWARELGRLLPEAGVALLCASLLFLAPVDWKERRFALTWDDAHRVNWGILFLFGGGLSLGTLAETTGLAKWVGGALGSLGIAKSPAGFLAVSIVVAILVSEFASNTASTTLLVPVVIAAAQANGLDPVRPALGVGLAATAGFIFPVSTPPNAIVFGTGLVPLPRMIRAGLLLDLASFLVIFLGLLALTPLLPK